MQKRCASSSSSSTTITDGELDIIDVPAIFKDDIQHYYRVIL
ncbi:hypothetical protein [Candidatus Nitrosocosmicus hydrocola]|nr:hypothetical protein [Candidatus Nitrosocosmicus hydrocola]